MVAAPTIRGVGQNGMPTQQAGDVILAFAFNYGSTTIPSFSSDWTVLGTVNNNYGGAIAYKISNGSSGTGTISNFNPYFTVSVAGAGTSISTGTSPSFLGGVTSAGGSPSSIPGMASAPSLLRLTAGVFIGGGGNPLGLSFTPATLISTINYVSNTYARAELYSGDNYGSITVTPTSYSWGGSSFLSIAVLPPNPPGFFAMF